MTRAEIEDFLYREAALLDDGPFAEWLALWIEGGPGYVVPTADAPDGDPRTHLAYIADDLELLRTRVAQLLDRTTVAEIPRTRTTRIVGNVRLLDRDAGPDGKVWHVSSRFVLHAVRHDRSDVLSGRYEHALVATGDGLRISGKRVALSHPSIPIGRLSFLL
ncbi:MAG: aromatic-ring-hydroxylating dioxygenase subunit beta [Kofleriaceae bacterium]